MMILPYLVLICFCADASHWNCGCFCKSEGPQNLCKLTIISYRIEVQFNESIWIGSLILKRKVIQIYFLNLWILILIKHVTFFEDQFYIISLALFFIYRILSMGINHLNCVDPIKVQIAPRLDRSNQMLDRCSRNLYVAFQHL